MVVEELPAGKQVTRRFPVLFSTAGEHELVARLPTDPVPADNERSLVIDVPAAVDVLIIDGDPEAKDAFFLATALAPGGKTTSGLRPVIESPAYLRDQTLEDFATVYLLNIDRLQPADVVALEDFVKAGGGLGVFSVNARERRSSTRNCIAAAKGFSRCRWMVPPSWSSIGWKRRRMSK